MEETNSSTGTSRLYYAGGKFFMIQLTHIDYEDYTNAFKGVGLLCSTIPKLITYCYIIELPSPS